MTNTDMYDVIKEKIIREWYDMQKKNKQDKWEIPKYSGKQIAKAGTILTTGESTIEEIQYAKSVLHNWRSSHAYPLQVIGSNLRQANPDAIVVQRLKRLESIENKLYRYPNMSLYRMQDLGGCRVIVDNIEQVYTAIANYKSSRIRHILKHEYDYIRNPKSSGYRSYHMVYQFHSDKKETYNQNMLIEIQFRTKLQHIWATAIEMMGILTKTNLKSSIGDESILRFFILVSSLFAIREGTPTCPAAPNTYEEIVSEIRYIENQYQIVRKLNSLNLAVNLTDRKNDYKDYKKGYYILTFKYLENTLNISFFKQDELQLAAKLYNTIETTHPEYDSVLVQADSFDMLKSAYPNYFVDISQFVDIMKNIIK